MPKSLIPSPFTDSLPPAWASGWGQDEYGYYAEFSLPTGENYWDVVVHRMRWIPAGSFEMGSPDDEPQREGRELPHRVTLSRGFWLGSTTCTQALWRAVLGTEPSRFQGDRRPVEQVSFEDVEKFLERANALIPGLGLSLPSEAQWEYACRAGTRTPFHTGRVLTTDQSNYDGNYPYAGGATGEYRHETVECGSLPPNGWGLHEMHGNVREWCSDWYGDYSPGDAVDPTGPDDGSVRVVRGGSWMSHARYVRSACRSWYDPGDRLVHLGFRCLSSASHAGDQESPNK